MNTAKCCQTFTFCVLYLLFWSAICEYGRFCSLNRLNKRLIIFPVYIINNIKSAEELKLKWWMVYKIVEICFYQMKFNSMRYTFFFSLEEFFVLFLLSLSLFVYILFSPHAFASIHICIHIFCFGFPWRICFFELFATMIVARIVIVCNMLLLLWILFVLLFYFDCYFCYFGCAWSAMVKGKCSC